MQKWEKFPDVFGVSTRDIDRLRDTLVDHNLCDVCMESTSLDRIPIGNILSVDFSLKLVNPYFIKQLASFFSVLNELCILRMNHINALLWQR